MMEEAKISQVANETAKPAGMPMLVTEDDLQLEIGRWVVASLNKDKILNRMVEIQQQQSAAIANMKATIDAAAPLAESNSKLGAKNKELGDAITAVRAEAKAGIDAAKNEANAIVATAKSESKAMIATAKNDATASISAAKADSDARVVIAEEDAGAKADAEVVAVKEEARKLADEATEKLEKQEKIIVDLKAKLAKLKPAKKRKK